MADVLSRLAGPQNQGATTTTYFTVPALHAYTILTIVVVNNSGATIKIKWGIGGVANSQLTKLPTTIGPGATEIQFATRLTLNAGDTFQVNADVTGATVTVSGLDQS